MKLDGSQLIKVHLDKNQQTNIEHKVCRTIERICGINFTMFDIIKVLEGVGACVMCAGNHIIEIIKSYFVPGFY